MTFRLSNQAKSYFKNIFGKGSDDKLDILWDEYYICLMIGFSEVKIGDEASADSEITKTFPQAYKDQRYEIMASLIASEIDRRGISKVKDIENLMLSILDHNSSTELSSEGHRLMNRYVAGGFEIIKENIREVNELHMFLIKYYDILINVTNE